MFWVLSQIFIVVICVIVVQGKEMAAETAGSVKKDFFKVSEIPLLHRKLWENQDRNLSLLGRTNQLIKGRKCFFS